MNLKNLKKLQAGLPAVLLPLSLIILTSQESEKKNVLYFILGGIMCLLQKPLNFI
jgi:hypothetical protein